MSQNLTQVDCGEVLTIAQASDVYAQLCVAFEEERSVSIDISKLERVDAAALQLLYSFQRDAIVKEMVIVWSEATKVFCDAVDILGLPLFFQPQ